MKKYLFVILIIVLSGCNTTDSVDSRIAYPARYIDLTAPEDAHLLENYWVQSVKKFPTLPMVAAEDELVGCIMVTFLINSDGRPDGYTIVNAYPKGIFEHHALAALARWRFTPGHENPEKIPVLTTTSLRFEPQHASNIDEARKRCDNLPAS